MQRIKKISTLTRIVLLLTIATATSGGYLLHHWYYCHHFLTSAVYSPALLELNTALTYLGYAHYQHHTPQEQHYLCKQIIHYCSQSLAIEPSASAHYHSAIAWRSMGQPYQAIKEFEYTLQLDQKHGDAYLQLAATLVETKQFDAAIDMYHHFLKQQPHNITVQQLLSETQQARAQRAQNDNLTHV
jgi:tetratricopeptide (TPR) repeat protein